MVSIQTENISLLRLRLSKLSKKMLGRGFLLLAGVLGLVTVAASAPHGEDDTARADSSVSPKWELTVSDPYYPIRPGLRIIYIITFKNIGDGPATNTTLVDVIDPLTEYLLSTGAGIYDVGSHRVTWHLGTIEPNEGGRVILRVTIHENTPDGTDIVNAATITCSEGARSDTTVFTPVLYIPILKVYKTTQLTTVFPGQEIVYDIAYTNLGDTSATRVMLTDLLPQQTSFISCTEGCLLDSLAENVYWHIGDLQPESLFTVQLTVRIDSTFGDEDFITNKATITCAEETSDSSFCTTPVDSTATASGAPAFAFSIESRDRFVQAGKEILYRIRCENIGRDVAHALIIASPVPEYTEYVACSNYGYYDSSSEKMIWSIEELERHQDITATLTLRVESPLRSRTPIINSASVTCSEGFSASSAETTVVLSAPKWDLCIDANPQRIIPGHSVTFTTQLRNIGNMNATKIVITNPLPSHTSYVRNTSDGIFDVEENTITWNIGSLNVNEEITVTLTVASDPDVTADEEIIHNVYVQNEEAVDSASISITVLVPQKHHLSQNRPNPFNHKTTICFTMSSAGPVLLQIFNTLGQEVTTLVNELRETGSYSVIWNGKDRFSKDVDSGMYFCRLKTGDCTLTKKMVLLR